MTNAHLKAAEQHERAAKEHRTAAEHNERGDGVKESWHAQRAMEYSNHAYKLSKETSTKSEQILDL